MFSDSIDKNIRLAGIIHESLVNGPGIRRVLFSQGCIHNCLGCFNKETHPFDQGKEYDMDEIIRDILINPIIKGVTFSGGDPFEQGEKFSYISKKLKEKNINIWCYTGYTYEYIISNKEIIGFCELINNIDVLVDGKFQLEKQKEGLKYRGSSNQRIIDVKESIINKKIIELNY